MEPEGLSPHSQIPVIQPFKWLTQFTTQVIERWGVKMGAGRSWLKIVSSDRLWY
jgi:hypothetical protein